MTLRQLQIFIVVARWLNLRKASEELRTTQPAVSHQLRVLQDELGQQLHRKVGSGIALTPAGERLLSEAKIIVARVENLKAKLETASKAKQRVSLCVGGSYNPSAVLLPLVLSLFKKEHPEVELQLRTNDRIAIEHLVLSGEIDVAVLHDLPRSRLLAMEPFRREPLIAFVAPDHPLAKKKRLAADDLKEVGFIIRNSFGISVSGKEYLKGLRRKGFAIKVAMQCDSPEAVKMAVTRKMGIGILYRDILTDSLRRGEFKTLTLPSDGSEGKSFIVYHKTRPLSGHALEFLNLLRTYRDA